MCLFIDWAIEAKAVIALLSVGRDTVGIRLTEEGCENMEEIDAVGDAILALIKGEEGGEEG
jgi:hypothetical protein